MKNGTTTETVADDETVNNLTPPTETVDPDPVTTKRRPGRPPKNATPPTAAKAPTNAGGRPSNRDKLARSLADNYIMLGSLLKLVAPVAGEATIAQAEQCGDAFASWAETNTKVKRALERALSGAGFAAVLAAHIPIALAVVAEVQMKNAAPVPMDLTKLGDSLGSSLLG